MKLPVPTKGSRMWTPLSPSERPNSFFRISSTLPHHEIDDRLRRVDDAVRVGLFGRVALEETLVNLVEKCLLFGEVGRVFSAAFDGLVEAVERAQELVSVERTFLSARR